MGSTMKQVFAHYMLCFAAFGEKGSPASVGAGAGVVSGGPPRLAVRPVRPGRPVRSVRARRCAAR